MLILCDKSVTVLPRSTPPINIPVKTLTTNMAVKLGQYINTPVSTDASMRETNKTNCGPTRSHTCPHIRVPTRLPPDVAVNSHEIVSRFCPVRSCMSGKAGPRFP